MFKTRKICYFFLSSTHDITRTQNQKLKKRRYKKVRLCLICRIWLGLAQRIRLEWIIMNVMLCLMHCRIKPLEILFSVWYSVELNYFIIFEKLKNNNKFILKRIKNNQIIL